MASGVSSVIRPPNSLSGGRCASGAGGGNGRPGSSGPGPSLVLSERNSNRVGQLKRGCQARPAGSAPVARAAGAAGAEVEQSSGRSRSYERQRGQRQGGGRVAREPCVTPAMTEGPAQVTEPQTGPHWLAVPSTCQGTQQDWEGRGGQGSGERDRRSHAGGGGSQDLGQTGSFCFNLSLISSGHLYQEPGPFKLKKWAH